VVKYGSDHIRSGPMAKSHDIKKDAKKQPAKTLKEKRVAKKEKKASKAG